MLKNPKNASTRSASTEKSPIISTASPFVLRLSKDERRFFSRIEFIYLTCKSELSVKSETGNPYGTPISVVSRIGNVLKIDRSKGALPDIHFIVSFSDIFPARVRELSISDEDAKATCVEKSLMGAGNAVDDPRNTDSILGSAPSRACQ